MPTERPALKLTVIVTIVSGIGAARNCLQVLAPQITVGHAEIIVPFDKWSAEIGNLATEFPTVNFHYIEDLGIAENEKISAHEHRLYDRRRAAGLQIAGGEIIAMTEDHALPAKDWCEQILAAHERSDAAVIGGAIENAVDKPLNQAWYFCDFGRYGRPFEQRESEFVSDVNVSYKREYLTAIRREWSESYHETLVHWALQKRGAKILLNENLVVYQNRPPLSLRDAFIERINWGRIFAETRTAKLNLPQRFLYAAGTVFLPPLLFWRAARNMRRQNNTFWQIVKLTPLLFFLLAGWSLGEFSGYLSGAPKASAELIEETARKSDKFISETQPQ